jgi:nicotinate-nucleotide--dimethylbenzimidazole phosphoribosyltransferase
VTGSADAVLARLLEDLPEPDGGSIAEVGDRARRVLRPMRALARMDEVAAWLAGWQRTPRPRVSAPAALVFAADHGVAAEGVSAYPQEVTAAMVKALHEEVATASVLARDLGVALRTVDVGVGRPTGNIAREPALDPAAFTRCVEEGRAAVHSVDADLLALGEVGIANTTAASAVAASLWGGPIEGWVGRGSGVDDAALARKRRVVSLARRRVGRVGPGEVLRQVGGGELVAIAGAVAEARARSIPVVLDGFAVTAAASALQAIRPGALSHCLAGHRSPETGHGTLLRSLGLRPLLDLDLRLGEGTGALLAVPLVRLASLAVTEVATFDEWGLRP